MEVPYSFPAFVLDTVPSMAASTGVPTGIAISVPVCFPPEDAHNELSWAPNIAVTMPLGAAYRPPPFPPNLCALNDAP